MNEIEGPFVIDLSDLIFDEKYVNLKKSKIPKNHFQRENEIKSHYNNIQLHNDRNSRIIQDKKTEKMQLNNKSKENGRKEDKPQEFFSKESNKEKINNNLFNKIDTFNSLNFLLDEKITKIKSKDSTKNKEIELPKGNMIEDFISKSDINSKSIKLQKTISDNPKNYSDKKEKKKKIEDRVRNNEDHDFFSPANNFVNKNDLFDKNAKTEKKDKRYESERKTNAVKPSYNDSNIKEKQLNNKKDLITPSINNQNASFPLNNTNSHQMRISSAQERTKKFYGLLQKDLNYEESHNKNNDNDETMINRNNFGNNIQNLNHKKDMHNNKNLKENDLEIFSKKNLSHSQIKSVNHVLTDIPNIKKQENLLNIPTCILNPIFLSNLQEKLNTIIRFNNHDHNRDESLSINNSSLTESKNLSQSFQSISNKNNSQSKKLNPFFSFYKKTFDDPLLQKHLFIHPRLRLRFLKAYPLNKKLIAKDYLYNIVNGEVKNIYGKLKENNIPNKSIYYIKLQKDKDIDEIYTKVYVTESILMKKLNRKEISVGFLENELGLNLSDTIMNN